MPIGFGWNKSYVMLCYVNFWRLLLILHGLTHLHTPLSSSWKLLYWLLQPVGLLGSFIYSTSGCSSPCFFSPQAVKGAGGRRVGLAEVGTAQEAKYIEGWPNTTFAWAGWSRFDIPVDKYGGVHSQLICISITLGLLHATRLASREILIEQNSKKRTGPSLCVLCGNSGAGLYCRRGRGSGEGGDTCQLWFILMLFSEDTVA